MSDCCEQIFAWCKHDDYRLDVDAGGWSPVRDPHYVCPQELLTLPDKQLIAVYTKRINRERLNDVRTVRFKWFRDYDAWMRDECFRFVGEYDVELPETLYTTYYAGHVFVFICEQNTILVFDAQTAELEVKVWADIALTQPVYFADKQNMRYLVSCSDIRVVDLTKLIRSYDDVDDVRHDVKPAPLKRAKQSFISRDDQHVVADVIKLRAPQLEHVTAADAEVYGCQLFIIEQQPLKDDVTFYVVDLVELCGTTDSHSAADVSTRKLTISISGDVCDYVRKKRTADNVTYMLFNCKIKNPFLVGSE